MNLILNLHFKPEGLILIDDKLISEDLFDKHFVCDLSACKGACCIEGESGAPPGRRGTIYS